MSKNKWWKLAAILVAVIAAGWVVRACSRGGEKTAKETVRQVTVVRQDLRITKTATGEVRPQNRVEIKPPIAGRIEEVLVREGDAVAKGDILVWMSSADRAALLDAAQAQDAETLTRWETAYKPAPLLAPLDGTIIVRAIEPGQTVTTADPVVVIADRLIVKAQVDETDIGAIKVGQDALISLDAFPQQPVQATVDHVAYEATTVNNVTIYEVDVLPEDVPDFMRSGMTATVTFTVDGKSDILVLPAEAVREERGVSTVRVAGSKPWQRPLQQEVATGLTDGKWIEIVSGLSEGDVVWAPSIRLPRQGREQGRNPFAPAGRGGGRRPSGSR
ncbi:MAG: macrolide transporter [Candidatus Omnitrophica bacterium CG11_big_fil_rev_8_21_14_0_20_63_9]|nr:MAG: macrolide transporter [Candidatus Omnitrophica bacterium CG11_big_fil_rev_8_21_14_0_20_63_9]